MFLCGVFSMVFSLDVFSLWLILILICLKFYIIWRSYWADVFNLESIPLDVDPEVRRRMVDEACRWRECKRVKDNEEQVNQEVQRYLVQFELFLYGLFRLGYQNQFDQQPTVSIPKRRDKICWTCQTPPSVSHKLSRCAGCRVAWYCGEECQGEDWDRHGGWCRKRQMRRIERR